MEEDIFSDLVGAVHIARYGTQLIRSSDLSKNPFFNELSVFQKTRQNFGKPVVTIPAIRSWLQPKSKAFSPKQVKSLNFWAQYIEYVVNSGYVKEPPLMAQLQQIAEQIKRRIPTLTKDSELPPIDPLVYTTLQSLFAASDRNPRLIFHDLFGDGDPIDPNDSSYYLLFRYSTNHGALLKSFIVFHPPDPSALNRVGFNHFIWGSEGFNPH